MTARDEGVLLPERGITFSHGSLDLQGQRNTENFCTNIEKKEKEGKKGNHMLCCCLPEKLIKYRVAYLSGLCEQRHSLRDIQDV